MDRAEEMRVRRDTDLRTLRKVHQRAKLIGDDWPCDSGTGAYDIIRMIEELIWRAEADREGGVT